MGLIGVVVLHYGSLENTRLCVASLLKTKEYHEKRLIITIVNNQGDKAQLSEHPFRNPSVTVLTPSENQGFAQGNNRGITYALESGAESCLLLNNDTVVDKGLIGALAHALETPEIGIAVPKIYFFKGSEFHKDRYKEEDLGKVIWYAGGRMDWDNVLAFHRGVDEVDKGQYDSLFESDFATGCCMLIKRTVFEKVGFFDPRYFLYYEDTDFSMRVKKAGIGIVFVPSAKLWHKNAESSGGSGSSLQDYYITRNRLLFGFTYAPFHARLSLIRESGKLFLIGRKWQKRGIYDFYVRRFGKGRYPVV